MPGFAPVAAFTIGDDGARSIVTETLACSAALFGLAGANLGFDWGFAAGGSVFALHGVAMTPALADLCPLTSGSLALNGGTLALRGALACGSGNLVATGGPTTTQWAQALALAGAVLDVAESAAALPLHAALAGGTFTLAGDTLVALWWEPVPAAAGAWSPVGSTAVIWSTV